ncbi:MAG TPA: class I SAM-dependent methyltransferase [Actinopolymorphaceae bacterium]|jgi:O-methyltransferase involved in polyketide biosynthesis
MSAHQILLTGEKETLFATLYGRALDARSPHPVLRDRLADEIAMRIEREFGYDFAKLGIKADEAVSVAIRAKYVDQETKAALARASGARVLHLGCGLDTRAWRVDPDARVEWYDVDYPEVIEVCQALFPSRQRHLLIGSSVTDEGWLNELPADRPVVVVAEGLVQYLAKEDLVRMVRAIVARFPAGVILFDAWNSFSAKVGQNQRCIQVTGAKLGGWGIDDPRELEPLVPGLHFDAAFDFLTVPEVRRFSWHARLGIRVMRVVRSFRDAARILRYRF